MSQPIHGNILEALLIAAAKAEAAGDYCLADQSDDLALRLAQVLPSAKRIVKPALEYLLPDQVVPAAQDALETGSNVLTGKGIGNNPIKHSLKGTPFLDPVNYAKDYVSNPSYWLFDLVPAASKWRFMNMIRSQLISAGFTELTDNRVWNAFSQQKGQHGLESLLRECSEQADKWLGPAKKNVDADTLFAKVGQWFRNIPANRLAATRQFIVRNFTSWSPKSGGFNLADERLQRAQDYIKSQDVKNADPSIKTEDLIKQRGKNLDDYGFDRSQVKQPSSLKLNTKLKGVNTVTGRISSSKGLIASIAENLKNNDKLLQSALARAGETEEGSKWVKILKTGTEDTSKLAKGLKVLGRIAVVIAVADIITTLPAAIQGDARAQADVAINSAGLLFPPIAIASALTSVFGIDLSDLLVTSAESFGESASGLDTDSTKNDLINSGMSYNPQTKTWEDKARSQSLNSNTGKTFVSEMINMAKGGMSINQAWLTTLKNMKSSGVPLEEIAQVREKYIQAKQMILKSGMIGDVKIPMWDDEQINAFEQSLSDYAKMKLSEGMSHEDVVRVISSAVQRVPNLNKVNFIKNNVIKSLSQVNVEVPKSQNNFEQNQEPMMSMSLKSRGERVSQWQQFLSNAGFFKGYTANTPPVFGPRTSRATMAFQSKYDLRVDGIVGPETLNKARQLGGKL